MTKSTKRILITVAVCFGFLLSTVAFLALGNPQSHKYVFLFQAYVFPIPEYDQNEIDPPENYTGIWRTWSKEGYRTECPFVDGRRHGKRRCWRPDGSLAFEETLDHGKMLGHKTYWPNGNRKSDVTRVEGQGATGPATEWFENGAVKEKGELIVGRKFGKWQFWSNDGKALPDKWFFLDEEATESEFYAKVQELQTEQEMQNKPSSDQPAKTPPAP